MIRHFVCLLFMAFWLSMTGCSKFKLLKDLQQDAVDAGVNLKGQTMKDYLATHTTSDLTALDLFSAAIQRAGLSDTLGTNQDHTAVFLTNTAMSQLLGSIGYASVNDVPPVILKNLLSDLIFKGRLKSTDLVLNETSKIQTINGNYIYLKRTSNTADQYVLYINQDTALSSSAALVRTQDLEFANGVAQVTSQFTFYRLQDSKPDDGTPGGNVLTQNLPVSKDVYIRGGTGNLNNNFNDPATIDLKAVSTADATVGRIGVMQYPLTVPSFGNKIGSAKLYVYIYNTGLTSSTIFSFSAYQGENKDWVETGITWTNRPQYNSIPLATLSIPGTYTGWASFDITSAVSQSYANNASFVNIFLSHNVDNFIKLRPREYQSGAYASYIAVTSPPQTILTLGTVSPLTVSAVSKWATLTTEHLKMNGTTDNNVIYTVTQIPANGYIVKYGIPLAVNASFSQADIAKGAIKYLYDGTGNTDKIVFQARDNSGGYYESDLSLDVQIN